MLSGGESSVKCYRVVHAVGREPWEYERPCTLQEIAAQKREQRATAEKAKTDLAKIDDRMKQYSRLMALCEKKFGPTVCNR